MDAKIKKSWIIPRFAGLALGAGCITVFAQGSGPQPETGAAEAAGGSMTLLLIFVFVSLGFSFLCSVLEAVLLSITPSFVASLSNNRPAIGERIHRLKDNIDRPLAAILTLNTVAHTLGAIGAGTQASALFSSKYVGLFSVVMTLLILYLSEIIPKTLGAVYWKSLAPASAKVLEVMIFCLYPFIIVSEQLTQFISRGKQKSVFSREEFAALAEIGTREGKLDEGESRILNNVFRFSSLKVSDIMTPRTVMFSLQQDLTVKQVMEEYERVAFSRIPIFGVNRDEVTGFVLRSDILLENAHDRHDTPLHALQRDLFRIGQGAQLPELLEFLLNRRAHIALVVSPYGGTDGLVTLEDLVETLLGLEIVDEADTSIDMQALARDRWSKRAEQYEMSPDKKPDSKPD